MLRRITVCAVVTALVFTMSLGTAFGCTTIFVGKNKTFDGSVMYAHTEESDNGLDAQHFVYNTAGTYSFIGSQAALSNGGSELCWGVNENQVSISNNIIASVRSGFVNPSSASFSWHGVNRLVLEQATSARHGVELVINYINSGRYTGTMYMIADPNEAWIIELLRAGPWVAKRLGDDDIYAMGNNLTIGQIDFTDDGTNWLWSDNVATYAIDRGWYTPASPGDYSDFNWKNTYNNTNYLNGAWYNLRVNEAEKKLNTAADSGGVTVPIFMETMRNNYFGTPLYRVNANGSPLVTFGSAPTGHRMTSTEDTDFQAIVHFRKDMPKEIGTVSWMSLATSTTSPYTPYYLGATEFPVEYQTGVRGSSRMKLAWNSNLELNSAYWTQRNIFGFAHANFDAAYPIVKGAWSSLEQDAFANQTRIEAEALEIYNKSGAEAASLFLNGYSNGIALSAYDKAVILLKQFTNELPLSIEPAAFVTKLNGNQNDLTINVKEVYFNGVEINYDATLKISNNAAGTYGVGDYQVYVDTKGNDQVRACYIVN
ncbi:MAG: C69 family dipeptidase [Clostridiales bacterium]|nr:C69 family dipeptidase [Clostridiales bacterium]